LKEHLITRVLEGTQTEGEERPRLTVVQGGKRIQSFEERFCISALRVVFRFKRCGKKGWGGLTNLGRLAANAKTAANGTTRAAGPKQ